MLDGCLEVNTPVRTVRQIAFKHGIPDDKRPIFWRILLGVLTTDKSQWVDDMRNKREVYANYRKEFSIEHLSLFKKYMSDNTPADTTSAASTARANMSQEEVVRQNMIDEEELTEDDELFEAIRKDIDRTNAELIFFRQSSVRLALIRVLFIYGKLNPGVMYVQGMNEVLAPLFYVLRNDTGDQEEYAWAENAEADAFFCFMNLMSEIMDLFQQGLDKTNMGIRNRLANLDQMLKRHDEPLWLHLQEQGVMCELYSLRWVSTLLSREFELPDTVLLWDYLFADESRFSFLDEICIAMLKHVRENLLAGGFSPIVKLLQHYPPVGVKEIVGKALLVRASEPRKLQWQQRKDEFELRKQEFDNAVGNTKAKLAEGSERAAAAAKIAANKFSIKAKETQGKMQAGMMRFREKMAAEMSPRDGPAGASGQRGFFRSSSSGSTGSSDGSNDGSSSTLSEGTAGGTADGRIGGSVATLVTGIYQRHYPEMLEETEFV
jgi:hypothetical protein